MVKYCKKMNCKTLPVSITYFSLLLTRVRYINLTRLYQLYANDPTPVI